MPRFKTITYRGREMNNIGIIAIPSKSERLHRKHLRPFAGKSLMEWGIIQLQACKYIGDIYIVTDGEEAKEIAEGYGVRVIVEPKNWVGAPGGLGYAFDWARYTIAIERHVDLHLERIVTHPLLKPGDLDKQFETYFMGRSIQVGTAYRIRDVQILKETSLNAGKACLVDFNGKYWHPAGFGHVREWRIFPGLQIFGSEQIFYEVEPWQFIDIHYEVDMEIAEIIFEKKILKGNPNAYQDYAKTHHEHLHNYEKPVISYGVEENE